MRRAVVVATVAALAILVVVSPGCCTSQVRRSVEAWRVDYRALDGLLVPDPSLPPETRAKIDVLRERLNVHLDELAVEVGADEEVR